MSQRGRAQSLRTAELPAKYSTGDGWRGQTVVTAPAKQLIEMKLVKMRES